MPSPFNFAAATVTAILLSTTQINDSNFAAVSESKHDNKHFFGYSAENNVFVDTSTAIYKANDECFISNYGSKYYAGQIISSITAARVFPDKYTLVAVDEVSDLGVTFGRLLFVSDSIDALGEYIQTNGGFENERLHFITGSGLF